MNTLHFKYAVEVERCGSITQAAESSHQMSAPTKFPENGFFRMPLPPFVRNVRISGIGGN